MTSRDFAFWLQGMFEVVEPVELNSKQTEIIKRHLNMVFLHDIDPKMGDAAHQEKLNVAHKGKYTEIKETEYAQKHGPKPSPQHVMNGSFGWKLPEETMRC